MILFTNDDVKTDYNETGYPSGELQHQYLFYQRTLYIYSGTIWTDSKELTEVGKVLKVDNEKYPDEEWEAAHLAIGQKVYVKAADYVNKIYVKRLNKEDFEVFLPNK
jgi:hypothetical protein